MTTPSSATKQRQITLVGPQNAGKTTLFNSLTGSSYKTVNYPGSTVSYSVGQVQKKYDVVASVKDTPGIPNLTASSADHEVTLKELFSTDSQNDLILANVDATQLSRHLYVIDQLKECGFPVLVCVTMGDLLKQRGKEIDLKLLSEELGLPVTLVDPRCPLSVGQLTQKIQTFDVEKSSKVQRLFESSQDKDAIQSRFKKVEAIEAKVIKAIPGKEKEPFNWDRLFLHNIFGGLIFATIMVGIFSSIFWLAGWPMDWIDAGTSWLMDVARNSLPESWLTDMVVDGVIAGIGSVVIFLPQIIILFIAMGILEDSGYLARGATIIDKPLTKMGLNGKSFLPLLSGFACAIPAMMAARTIESRKERLITIFIVPLMSCSARLPVYVLLLAFLIPEDKPWIGGLAMTALYVGGIVVGAVVATIISRLPSFRHRGKSPLMLELPAFRKPILKVVGVSTYHRSMHYLKKAGPTIIVISLGLWLLTHLPVVPSDSSEGGSEYATVSQSYAAKLGKVIEPVVEPMGLDWRGGVAMTMGFAAREVFVASMALMYRIEEEDEDELQNRLLASMRTATFDGTDKRIFTTSSAIGLLFFFMVALQCFPTTVTAKAELGGWKIPLIQLVVYTGSAWLGAVTIVQTLRAMGFS